MNRAENTGFTGWGTIDGEGFCVRRSVPREGPSGKRDEFGLQKLKIPVDPGNRVNPVVKTATHPQSFGGALQKVAGAQKCFGGALQKVAGAQKCFGGALQKVAGAQKCFGGALQKVAGAQKCFGGVLQKVAGAQKCFGGALQKVAGAQKCFGGALQKVSGVSKGLIEGRSSHGVVDFWKVARRRSASGPARMGYNPTLID